MCIYLGIKRTKTRVRCDVMMISNQNSSQKMNKKLRFVKQMETWKTEFCWISLHDKWFWVLKFNLETSTQNFVPFRSIPFHFVLIGNPLIITGKKYLVYWLLEKMKQRASKKNAEPEGLESNLAPSNWN